MKSTKNCQSISEAIFPKSTRTSIDWYILQIARVPILGPKWFQMGLDDPMLIIVFLFTNMQTSKALNFQVFKSEIN